MRKTSTADLVQWCVGPHRISFVAFATASRNVLAKDGRGVSLLLENIQHLWVVGYDTPGLGTVFPRQLTVDSAQFEHWNIS